MDLLGSVYVSFQFDTEDFVTPETDDVLLRLTDILDQFGVKGSFCIVGEKARVLEKRGRLDILEALKRHDVAYQSNFHSVHPVISEYLQDAAWDEGVEEVKKREGPGVKDLERIFGVKPSAFIQPGGSWAPETPYASREMGVSTYVDGIFRDNPVWFCGSLCFRASMGFPEHATFADLDSLKSRFDGIYGSKTGGGLLTIVMHPCMFVTEDFWDAVNFSRRKTVPEGKVVPPPLRAKEKLEESLQVFQRFVGFILEHPNVKIVPFREVAGLFREPEERKLNMDQVFVLAKEASERNDWQVVDGVSVSPAEMLRLFVDVLVDYLQKGVEPESMPLRFTLGPMSKPSGLNGLKHVNSEVFLGVAQAAKEFMDRYGRLPSAVTKNGVDYGPGVLLEAAAKMLVSYSENGSLPDSVKIRGVPNLPEVVQRWDLINKINGQWRWIVFPAGFRSKRIEELTLWQTWTMRPAVLTDG